MNFTLRQFTDKGLQTVAKATGGWTDLADAAHKAYQEEDRDQYPLATQIKYMMENEASDNDYSEDEVNALHYSQYIDNAADSVMHVNAPFIYKGNKQITLYPREVYQRLEAIAKAECDTYFDGKPYIHPTVEVKAIRTNATSTKTKAQYPGCYNAPTKSNPLRAKSSYRSDGQTILIGYFPNIEEAIEAKKAIEDKQ